MSFFGRNIKKIRAAKKLSQTAFADLFDLKRASIGAYEEGRAEAKIDTVIEIANHFKLTLNQILAKEITLNEIYHISNLKNRNNKTVSNEIPIVRNNNFKKHVVKHKNIKYINSLEKIIIPNSINLQIAFEYLGDKMTNSYPNIKHNDILICENIIIEKINTIIKDSIVVVLSKKNIFIGRFSITDNNLKINYDNSNYQTDEIKLENIKNIYVVKKVISDCNILKIQGKVW